MTFDVAQLDEEPPRREGPRAVTTVEELDKLDPDIMVRGYRAGLKNEPNYTEPDRAYWHGYMNGQVDGGHIKISPEQAEMARAYVASLLAPK